MASDLLPAIWGRQYSGPRKKQWSGRLEDKQMLISLIFWQNPG